MDSTTKSYIAAGALMAGGLAVYGIMCLTEPSSASGTAVDEGPDLAVRIVSAAGLVLATLAVWAYFRKSSGKE